MTLSRFFMYALFIHHCFGIYVTCTEYEAWHTALFLMSSGCRGSWLWACLLQLIWLYAKKNIFLQHRLESRDLTLVNALFLYHSANASNFELFTGCLNLFLFLFIANLHFLLCCILWEASSKNMLTVPLTCEYSHYWLSG